MSSAEGAAEQPAHEQRLEQPQQHQQQATLQIAAGAAPAAPGTPQNVQHSPGQRRPPMQWPPKSDAGDQPQMPPYLPPGYPPQAYWPPQARFMYPEGQQPPQQPGFPGHPYYLQVPQQQFLSNQQHPQTSTADEGEKANTNPPQQSPHHPHYNINMQRPMPAGQPPMMMAQQPPQPQQYPPSANAHLLKPVQREAVDKLVGVPTELVPPSVMPQRRDFFEQLVLLNEQHNETLTAPPQVSKSPVDLHRLYIAVRKAGGFKKVCDDKSWKGLCREANPSMTESSAAGYQLRRHYQKYLLALECRETGADMSELIAYAEKLKKKKKEKEPVPGGPSSVGQPGQPGTPAPAHNPPTPNSIRSAVTPTPAAATPGPPAQATPVSAAAAVPGYPPHNSADPQQPPYYYQQPGQPLPHHPAYPGWSGQPLPPGFPQHAYPPHVRPPGAAGYPPGYGPQFHQQPTMPGQQNLPGLPNMAQGLTPASTLQPASNLPPSASNLPPTAANLPPTASTLQPAQPGQQPAPQPASQQPAPPQIQPPAIKTEQDQQPLSVGDQSSRSTPAPPPQTSRPPSQAHYQPPSTPDTHEQQRPNSRQPVKPAAHTPVPTSSTASMPGPAQPPPQMPPNPMNMPPHTSQPYYPSQAYRPVPNRPQYSVGYPDPNQYQHPNMYPPQQQQMWPPTSQPAVPPRFMNPPQMPGKPQQEFRRPQPPSTSTAPPPQGQYYMQNQQMASPSSSQRQQRVPPQVQQMPPAATTTAQQYPMHMQQRQMPVNPSFPPGCIEATASAAALRRKRPRAYAREMTWATPKRLTMALRSGLELDTLWAINTLTVILYDDTAQPLLLSAEPQLLSLCLEHFKALLAVLYPKDFKLIDNAVKLQVFDDFSEATDKPHKNSVVEMAKLNSKPDKKSKKQNNDFTAVSRTGRKVYVEKNVRKPFLLERIEKNGVVNGNIKEEKPSIDDKPKEKPKFISGLCHRIYQSLLCKIESKKGLQRLHFSKHDVVVDEEEEEEEEFVAQSEDDLLFFRRPKENETWNRDGNPDVSLIPRPSPLINRDACLEEIGDRLLAMSNIIRGFSFFPGNEKILYNNLDLLDLIGRLLMLKVKRDEQLKTAKIVKVEEVVKPDDENEKKPVPSEVDSNRKMLLEVANQLRDDAFTILSHISVQLDLYNVDSGVAYGLLDALIYWAVTHNVQAKDPINGAVYSPKLYTFEIICKMSLLEANIDLLLSTGPWPRIEEFVRVVANSVNMSEELPLREFAIVILTAVCQASEPACIVATLETDVIQNLVSFLEAAEFNITTIATTEGVSVLRDNPERMGTSFGMLRRAAQILACLAQYEVCRPYFVKHQSRLLSFTVSSYMDSRVAGMVAGILYDLQHIPKELLLAKEVSLDESHRLAEAFPSYKWKVSDDTEDPPEPFLNVTLPPPTNPFHVEAQKELGSVSISPDSRSMSPNKTNGTAEVNGNRQKHRKRSRHSDGREMTALESALLNDSDAESGPESDGETSQPNSDTNSLPAAQPAFKTASSTVKEKLRNNINMKHGISENGHDEEPEAKRQRISNGVSAVSPKCNGDLNNKVRPNKSENGNGTPTKQSGSMAAVA